MPTEIEVEFDCDSELVTRAKAVVGAFGGVVLDVFHVTADNEIVDDQPADDGWTFMSFNISDDQAHNAAVALSAAGYDVVVHVYPAEH
jgi:hypothetical protein